MIKYSLIILSTLLLIVKTQTLIESNNKLALDLLNVFPKSDNNFFSPLSITSCLLMLLNGANGITEKELKDLLNIEDESKLGSINNEMKKTLTSIAKKNINEVIVKLENLLLVANNNPLNEKFENIIRNKFVSAVEAVDFANNSPQITKDVNDWIKEQTNNKIQDLLKGPLSTDTKLVLLNAIYFKGLWKHPFSPINTVKDDFYNFGKNEPTKVDMMSIMNKFKVMSVPELDAKLLEMPFTNSSNISMIILLPNEINGLDDMTQNLTLNILNENIFNLQNKREINTRLKFPKFVLKTEYELKEPLNDLGVKSLFQDSADLSGINLKKDLKVSKAIHKAFIEVNEEGAEAAAVTGIIVVIKTSRIENINVNRPFMFFIINQTNGLILFSGQVRSLL